MTAVEPTAIAPGALDGLRLCAYTDAVEVGGAEIALATLLAALDPGIDVTVMGNDRAVVDRLADARPGSRTVITPTVAGLRDLPALGRLRGAIRDARPEVFHASLPAPFHCRYALAAAETLPGVKTVAVEQLVIPLSTRRVKLFKRVGSRFLDAHIAVSDASARDLERDAGLPAGSVRTIHNAVADDALVPEPRVADAPILASLARLDPVKGLDVLLRALPRLPDAHLVVVGEGAERGALERLATELGVADRVHLVGWRDDARRILTACDVFVLPSRAEGLPLSIAEAMLAGLPVVATDVGGVREIVTDDSVGTVVRPDDPGALVDAIAPLLADPARRRALGEAARARARAEFTAPVMARRYERVYAEITGRLAS